MKDRIGPSCWGQGEGRILAFGDSWFKWGVVSQAVNGTVMLDLGIWVFL